MLTNIQVIEFLISRGPGRTELELAQAIYGPNAYQQQVNQDCGLLVRQNILERRGRGGVGDPFRYYRLVPRVTAFSMDHRVKPGGDHGEGATPSSPSFDPTARVARIE